MKKIILIIPLILILLIFHTPLVLADNIQVVTPQELFLIVEKSIPERRTSQLEKESTLAAATQASLLPNPEVQTSLGSRAVDTGSTDDTGPSIQLSISQELDIWGVREAKSKVLKAEADLPAVKLTQIERERFFQVALLIADREVIESHSKQLREDLADGDGHLITVQIKKSATEKPENFRVKFESHICGGCDHAEYACTCDE